MIQAEDRYPIMSWNVRGCSEPQKREVMDQLFKENGYRIVALQETRLAECTMETMNYFWFNVNNGTKRDRIGGGTAILVAKAECKDNRFKRITSNSCSYLADMFGDKVLVVSTYIRTERQTESGEFQKLFRYIVNLPQSIKDKIIIVGDFNAHIGKMDLTPEDRAVLGNNLYHDYCNENGTGLKNFLHGLNLKNYMTFSSSKSVATTWTNGKSISQIDHIVMSKMNIMKIPKICAYYNLNLKSDHKMIECILKMHKRPLTDQPRTVSNTGPKRMRFDLELLKSNEEKNKFQERVNCILEKRPTTATATVEEKWFNIQDSIINAAKSVLQKPGSPPTPRRMNASKNYFIAHQRQLADRSNQTLKAEAKKARKEKKHAYIDHFNDKVETFLREIENENPLSQMTKTYKFIKSHKRTTTAGNRRYIPIQRWNAKLQESASNEQNQEFETFPEDDGRDAGEEPTKEEIRSIIWDSRNNCAPGLDNVHNEFLKYGSEELLDTITDLIREVFRTNTVPKSWRETVQIPIPKIHNAQNIDDYRCITLCPSIYKIYSKILLDRLRNQIDPIPAYQMAFQAKRSAADQIFVLRRILDERWRKGCKTIIVSLDIKQAFDRLDISKAGQILLDMGVSKALVNRIINACLQEKTSLQWYGQRTRSIKKMKGVKQGCPLSPQLFILMLHHVLMSVQQFIPELKLTHEGSIKPPCILGYADDVTFICRSEEEVEKLLDILEPLLHSVGLEINVKKTKVLYRDPELTNNVAPEKMGKFGKYELPVVTTLKNLGAQITSSLTRGATTADRIRKAQKAFHHLCSFLKQHPLKLAVILKLYHCLITPVVTYSMEVSTIIKRNRDALRKMENEMLKTLKGLSAEEKDKERNHDNMETSNPRDSSDDQSDIENDDNDTFQQEAPELLKGYTINNKIRVARLNYYGHIIRSEHGGILKSALEYKIDKPKKIGRPAYTWRTCIRQDVERTGISLPHWQDVALDRSKIKEQTKKLYDTLVESEYGEDSGSDWDSDDSSLTPSVFYGFSEEEISYEGEDEN
uniref:Putative reverse transcriptase n=1 Tax=Aedes aegypti TaxID=7159 RepID=A0A0N8ES07_AEDAE